jgi:hypothetical protein
MYYQGGGQCGRVLGIKAIVEGKAKVAACISVARGDRVAFWL